MHTQSLSCKAAAATALAALLLLWAAPARAEGSLALVEVLQAVRSNAKLATEIEVQVKKANLKVGDVTCIGGRHGNQWRHLGGGRAAPYECEIGDKQLKIEATRIYFDRRGKPLGELGKAPDRVLFEKAVSFREIDFRWQWSQL